MLEGILEDIKFVNVVEVKLSLGPNALISEVTVGIRESIPKVRHVLVGVLTVIVKATRIPWGIRRHNCVGKQVELLICTGACLETWETIGA